MQKTVNPIIFGNARFTVITPELIRLEYSDNQSFIDDKTLFAENRNMLCKNFKMAQSKNKISIETDKIKIVYSPDGKPFSKKNIYAVLENENKTIKWYPGLGNRNNLGGTLRTLDQARGKMPLGDGLLSRDGWHLIDDSNEPVIHKEWIFERQEEHIYDWYLFNYGNDYKLGLKLLTTISGEIPLPRRYALGSWYSRYWPYSSDDYREIVKEFREKEFPLDIMVLDMDWHKDGWTGWSWNRKLLPDAEKLLKDIHNEKLFTTLNVHPADGMLPHEDMYYDFMKDMGINVNPNSSEKPTLPFDASDKKYITTLFKHTHAPRQKEGVDFWWLDWQQFDKTVGMKSLRNLPWLNRYYFNYTSKGNQRGISFSRWGGWGDHKNPIHFSGDSVSIWPMLEFEIPFTSIAGNVGCFFWSHDIGGHFGGINPETNARWIQFGSMSAALRLHSTRDKSMDKRPWLFEKTFADSMQAAFKLRSELFPYIYTSSWESCKNSIPLIRPMYIEYPKIEDSYDTPQQYFFGDHLLVAPITSAGFGKDYLSSQRVWFPKGVWYNYFTNEKVESNNNYDIIWSDINTFPLFVKAGIPLPLSEYSERMASEKLKTVRIRIYPGSDKCKNQSLLYEDDGISQDHKKGKFSITKFEYSRNTDTHTLTIFPAMGKFKGQLNSRNYIIEFPALQKQDYCLINNCRTKVIYDEKTYTCKIRINNKSISEKIIIKLKSNEVNFDTISQNIQSDFNKYICSNNISLQETKALAPEDHSFNIKDVDEKLKTFFTGIDIYKNNKDEIYITKSAASNAENKINLRFIDYFGSSISKTKTKYFILRKGSTKIIRIKDILKNDFGFTSRRIAELSSNINGKTIYQYCLIDEVESYLLKWHLIGPFSYSSEKKLVDQIYEPEKEKKYSPEKSYLGKDNRKIKWYEYKHENIYNVVDLRRGINEDTAIAYGTTKIFSSKAQNIRFEINSDDGCEIWLNNKKIHCADLIRTIVHEPEIVNAKLMEGENILFAKISQAEGSWELKIKIDAEFPVTNK